MFKKWFQKKEEILFAPLRGKVIPLTEVPDPTFSEKMLGEGFAILPSEGKVFSPVDGKVVQIFPTKHAIGIQSKGGLEILIHIGLETVTMEGKGFTSFVNAGDKVRVGDPLIHFSLTEVKEKAKSTITPIVITNGKDRKITFLDAKEVVPSQDPILSIQI